MRVLWRTAPSFAVRGKWSTERANPKDVLAASAVGQLEAAKQLKLWRERKAAGLLDAGGKGASFPRSI